MLIKIQRAYTYDMADSLIISFTFVYSGFIQNITNETRLFYSLIQEVDRHLF